MKTLTNTILLLLFVPLLVAGQAVNEQLGRLYQTLYSAKNDTARMKAYIDLASYYRMEDRDSSLAYIEKALPIAARLNLKYNEASILNSMGIILMQEEKFSRSLECYLKALSIAKDPAIEKTIWHLPKGITRRKARLLLLSDCYDLIGILNAYTGKWTDNVKNQMKNYLEAEKYAEAAGDRGQMAYIKFHMGIAYMNENKLDSALMFIRNSISTFSELKDRSGKGRAMKYLGDTYAKLGNLNLASRTILESVSLLKEKNDYVHLALAYISLNGVYTALNKNDSALYYARESLKIFEKRKDPFGKKESYNLLSDYYVRTGQTDSATIYLKLAKLLSDSLAEEERKNLLAFQDVVFEEQAKLEKMEKEKIENRGKLKIYLLLSGILVFIVIASMLYRNNIQRKKTAEILRQRNKEMENTLLQLKSTQNQLIQSEKMASLGELTAGIAHEIQNPLNFVNNFSELNLELIQEMRTELQQGNNSEAGNISELLEQNLQKIHYHGRRADSIVKGMLQHSRSSTGKKEPTHINALCDEYLRLSYHGLRAKNKNFNAKMITDYDKTIGEIDIIPQDVGRVILNLLTNAFHAVDERNQQPEAAAEEKYIPTVYISTKKLNGKVAIIVSDNGNGIPGNIVDKIFQPFFTTKPSGKGTGLGLSLSYDIIKSHGGEIILKTKPEIKEGTIFTILLPA